MSAYYLVCTNCDRHLEVSRQNLEQRTADWQVKTTNGKITAVVCPPCHETEAAA